MIRSMRSISSILERSMSRNSSGVLAQRRVTSVSPRRMVNGVRSSCEASPENCRTRRNDFSRRSSIWLRLATICESSSGWLPMGNLCDRLSAVIPVAASVTSMIGAIVRSANSQQPRQSQKIAKGPITR